ncbi:PE-PPE domain-containing protein, partial [Mycobacterium sp. ITM-2017-0098]
DPNLPNGGLMSRFPGLYIPILDMPFNGPAATDTEFQTVEISRQYDGFTDFPLYPFNIIADLNAVLGIVYLHTRFFDVSLPADDPT